MVIEMTKFFSGDNELLAPIKSTKGGVVNITGKFKSEGSVIDQIKSFEDNVTVKSYLSYSVTADLLGLMVIKKDEPMTVKVGQKVLTAKFGGQEIKLDEQDYMVCKLSDILAIVE